MHLRHYFPELRGLLTVRHMPLDAFASVEDLEQLCLRPRPFGRLKPQYVRAITAGWDVIARTEGLRPEDIQAARRGSTRAGAVGVCAIPPDTGSLRVQPAV